MTEPLVWLPFHPERMSPVPEKLRYQQIGPDFTERTPPGADEVELVVLPYQMGRLAPDAFAALPRLRVIQTMTAGVDHVRRAVPPGVLLCNGRGIHDSSTAELALTLTLASLRGLPGFVRDQERHHWEQIQRPALADKRVLIVGYGQIGAAIERRLLPFEVEVTRVARSSREGVHAVGELGELLPDADVVILILPDTPETKGLFDAGLLGRMKPGALLVNVARGTVVDTDALVEALRAGHITAALDVTDPEPLPPGHPLWDAPGVLITPHVGGASSAMWPRAYRIVREQLERFAAGETMANEMTGAY